MSTQGICRYLILNDIPTKLMFCDSINASRWDEKDPQSLLPDDIQFQYDRLIVFIPGFLGEIEFYHEFLMEIHNQTGIPVIGVSNSGHNRIPKHMPKPKIKSNRQSFSLAGQIQHKITLIRKHISKTTMVILMGHSIGCYMACEIMHQCPDFCENKLHHSILLHPVIDRLSEIKEAQIGYKLSTSYYRIGLLLSCVFNCLKTSYQKKIVKKLLALREERHNLPSHVTISCSNLFDPYCWRTVCLMGADPLHVIQTPRWDLFKQLQNKLTLMYSDKDRYTPDPDSARYFRWLRAQLSDCPGIDVNLDMAGIDHAFVFDSEETLAAARISSKSILKNVKI